MFRSLAKDCFLSLFDYHFVVKERCFRSMTQIVCGALWHIHCVIITALGGAALLQLLYPPLLLLEALEWASTLEILQGQPLKLHLLSLVPSKQLQPSLPSL